MADQVESTETRMRRRLKAWEPRLGAVGAIDDAAFAALEQAEGPLAGVAVGVKDVVDVAGLPTRNGSAAFADAPPAARDAPVVASLRSAGAAILCKTVTTEFAFIDPTPTLNPHDPQATPGGSSSGSGAAVGAEVLDLAIGTQTAGSLCRPAAYCGAVGFKPSFGALPTQGLSPLSPSFDTLGFIAADVSLAQRAFAASRGAAAAADGCEDRTDSVLRGAKLAVPPIDPQAPMSPEALAALDAAQQAAAGAGAEFPPLAEIPTHDVDLAGVVADHRIVMLAEAAAAHGALLARSASALRPKLRAALAEGLAIAPAEREAALARLSEARARFWEAMARYDALLTPPTPGSAPHRDNGTGYQHLLTPWTVFGGPLVCLPWGADAQGRPLSVMLASAPGRDSQTLALAAALETAAPERPRAKPPHAEPLGATT